MGDPVESCGIGQPVRRKEDFRLLTGKGEFSDDTNVPGQAYAYIARSPHAHARILRIDCEAARKAPGVIAVLTGADYLADGLKPLPNKPVPPDLPLKNRNGRPLFFPPDYPLATDKVRHAGEGVALVVAESRAQAKDAAELVEVEYEILDAVVDPAGALAPGAPAVWDEVPNNLCVDDDSRGDKAKTDEAFARAAHVARIELHNNRVNGVPLEPRAAIGVHDPSSGRHTLFAGSQGVLIQKRALAALFGVSEDKVRVVARDTGGGFGTRNLLFREFVLAVWAAKRVGRPVKWTCERGEAFLSDPYGRDQWTTAELALDRDGKFLAVRARNIANIGSHTLHYVPLVRGAAVTTGVYAIPTAHVELQAVFTNTVPTTTLRGAGRPEAMYIIERLIDVAAAEMSMDRAEIRRRNFISPAQLPFVNPIGTRIDSGEFLANMNEAMKMADWEGFPRRREEARGRGKLRGIGLGNYIETATGIPPERAVIEVSGKGRVQLVLGTQASGQGHETSFAQVVVEFLGIPFDLIDVHEGDSDIVKMGSGSHSSRSMRLGGLLLGQASKQIIEQGKRIAAGLLEASEANIEYARGRFTVAGTDRSLTLFEVAASTPEGKAGRPGLSAASDITRPLPTFPNGCHVCEVELDPATGEVTIERWCAVDDVGRVINPLLVDGQTHGGIVQGVGQAMLEDCVYDPQSGQLLSGSFMDYGMPRADQFPAFELECNEVLAPSNPLGIKGAGEGGMTGAPPALINAIVDALRERGVKHIEMPATPEKVWRAIHQTGE